MSPACNNRCTGLVFSISPAKFRATKPYVERCLEKMCTGLIHRPRSNSPSLCLKLRLNNAIMHRTRTVRRGIIPYKTRLLCGQGQLIFFFFLLSSSLFYIFFT
ncbi:hypothetical protein QCA50_005735 [Cerrena zonata]|uniref:Uncharacterized protein n=1 Tax=Cerrena zonata TaxID=2478898 RepID=A0AAW0GB84_9APHY